jgi:small subunit ribosomal protein S1
MPATEQSTTNQSPESFAALFETSTAQTGGIDTGGEGQIVSGIIVQVNRDSVVVDIGGKSEGVISKSEFLDACTSRAVRPTTA